jgi:LysM repeat protein
MTGGAAPVQYQDQNGKVYTEQEAIDAGLIPGPGGTPGGQYQIQSGDTLSKIAAQQGMSVNQLLAANPQIADPNMIYAGQLLTIPGGAGWADAYGTPSGTPGGQYQTQPGAAAQGGFWNRVGEYIMPGQDNVGLLGNLQNTLGGMFGGGGAAAGGGAGGMFGGLGSLAMAGIPAYLLGKMAYDEAKADKGVPLTPLTTMGPTGRYNIEAEIARRMGTQSPNPIEYGLLPRGTIPTLSGGQPAAQGIAPLAADPGYDMVGLFR